jgi:hypothetical protein
MRSVLAAAGVAFSLLTACRPIPDRAVYLAQSVHPDGAAFDVPIADVMASRRPVKVAKRIDSTGLIYGLVDHVPRSIIPDR